MFLRFEPAKSTKGASKMRRDLINAEISNLRDLLPLPPSTRQRLSQLQLMALVCVYVRKMNYFQQFLKSHDFSSQYQETAAPTPNIGFSKALNGFMMMMTQNGKLLYISENAAEYLGHSMEDLLIHGDSVYDIIDRQDHQTVQTELNRSTNNGQADDLTKTRMFFCRMNVSRNARRQMRFGDQKVVLVRGHFVSYVPLCSRNEPVFVAACAPLAMPETRECVVHGATNVFTTLHSMDMKIVHIDAIGEWYLGWERSELQDVSWYQLIHWENLREAQTKHRLITHSEQEKSCIMLLRMQKKDGEWIWIHAVLQVKESSESQTMIVCTNQVLSESEAEIMTANSWLYHYYSVQNKPHQLGANFDPQYAKYYQNGTYYQEQNQFCQNEETSPYSHHMGQESEPTDGRLTNPEMQIYQHGGHQVCGPEDPAMFACREEHLEGQRVDERCRGLHERGGPVDYSTHSPNSTGSSERSPHQYDYTHPEEVAVNGSLYVYPVRYGAKRKHPETIYQHPSILETEVPQTTFSPISDHHFDPRDQSRVCPPAMDVADPAECIDRWNPSPPWSDSVAMQKMTESFHRFSYPVPTSSVTPLTPTDHHPHFICNEE